MQGFVLQWCIKVVEDSFQKSPIQVDKIIQCVSAKKRSYPWVCSQHQQISKRVFLFGGSQVFFFRSAQHVESIHFTRWCEDCGILFSVEENSQKIHPPNKSHCLFKIPGVVRGHVVCRVRVSQRASYLQFRSWYQKSSNGQLGSEIVFLNLRSLFEMVL